VLVGTVARLVGGVESTWRRLRYPNCGFKCHRVHDRAGRMRSGITRSNLDGDVERLARLVRDVYDLRENVQSGV